MMEADAREQAIERVEEALLRMWDYGNALGLDGWIGPERGETPDDYAIEMRKLHVGDELDDLAPLLRTEAAPVDDEYRRGLYAGADSVIREELDAPYVKAERDELGWRMSELLCELTGGRMSKTNYDVPTMVREIEDYFERTADEDLRNVTAERDELRANWLDFTSKLGFGDNKTERAATLAEMVDPIEDAFAAQRDHFECAVTCELCGERLADTDCEHCHGSGCGPGTALGAYAECDWCGGAGKIHVGCVEESYADLAAERDELRRQVEWVVSYCSGISDPGTHDALPSQYIGVGMFTAANTILNKLRALDGESNV